MRKNKKSKMEKLKEIANEILKENAECILSGSLALNMQGLKTRREPIDIDIYLPFNTKFKKLPGMISRRSVNEEDYENEYYERFAYTFNGVDIDIFTPISEDVPALITDDETGCVKHFEIIKFKVSHAFGESFRKYKHKDDIIHILVNNFL